MLKLLYFTSSYFAMLTYLCTYYFNNVLNYTYIISRYLNTFTTKI